ncbi:hypothetical protein ARMGADRAFT_1031956 [Armillaria gallica]|uniref:Uncharacterized protein n=1 Tax=Armillaria gallica TaxID=47427 RepID=A0A2H3DBV7_ARMGA|nr:hypothetical protein ARMGADRAFT_1031956 [Armillaria gallica]
MHGTIVLLAAVFNNQDDAGDLELSSDDKETSLEKTCCAMRPPAALQRKPHAAVVMRLQCTSPSFTPIFLLCVRTEYHKTSVRILIKTQLQPPLKKAASVVNLAHRHTWIHYMAIVARAPDEDVMSRPYEEAAEVSFASQDLNFDYTDVYLLEIPPISSVHLGGKYEVAS